jgi:hypothetical protein
LNNPHKLLYFKSDEATGAAGAVAVPGGDELGIFRGSAVFGSEVDNVSGITAGTTGGRTGILLDADKIRVPGLAVSNGSWVFI